MPLHAYKTFVGIAADRVNATLTSATSVGATSLPLSNTVGTTGTLTTTGATYSAIILDGVNSEVVACTANFTAGAIACAATANAHPANVYVAFQVTASIGPTAYWPLDKFDPIDEYAQLLQETYSGSAVKTIAAVQGLRKSSWDLGGPIIADTIGYALGGILGAEDFSAGTPNTHTFSVINTGNLQPVSWLLYNYDAFNTRVFSGKFNELILSFDPSALIKFTSKFLSRASGVVSTPATAFSALKPLPAYSASATIAGAASQKVTLFEVTFTRDSSEQVPTLQGIQDPYAIWLGPLQMKGKFNQVKEDDVALLQYIQESQPTFLLSSAQGTGSTATALNVQMTVCNFMTAKVAQQGKPFVTEEFTFEGIANSTDATTSGTGLTPGRVVLKNAIGSGVYV